LGKATKEHMFIEGLPPGHKEQDPSVWVNALIDTIRSAIKSSGVNPRDIRAIGVSGQQHGLVPLDEYGRVIRPAKLWNDTSTFRESKYLIRKLGGLIRVISVNER